MDKGILDNHSQPVRDEEVVEVKTQPGGRCTRCGRALKRSFMVNGAAYGPVCVKKLFNVVVENRPKLPSHRRPPIQDTTQQTIFDVPLSDIVYIGTIEGDDEDRTIAAVKGGNARLLPLEESLRHVNHSPTGYCWGYGGSGPAQAAFAILYDYLNGDLERVFSLYQDFKFKVIAGLPQNSGFKLTGQQIEAALTAIDVARLQR